MTSWWACAQDHEAHRNVDAPLAHGFDEPSAHGVVLGLIAEGHCPACPDEVLAPVEVTLYWQLTTWAHGGCCRSDWRAQRTGADLAWESRPGPEMRAVTGALGDVGPDLVGER